jgi:hypothetical protein
MNNVSSRTCDAEIAELIHELRQAWFGRVEPKLSTTVRWLVAFAGSFVTLMIMVYLTSSAGSSSAQSAQFQELWFYILLLILILALLLASFISKSDRPAGYLRTFLTGSAVTALPFTMVSLPLSIMYRVAG